jgi:acyl carrier protein
MTNEQTRNILREFILTSFLPGEDPKTLSDSTLLVTSGIVTSLALLELATFIEDRFSLTLGDEDVTADRMDSIDLLLELIDERSGRVAAAGESRSLSVDVRKHR